MDQSIDQLSNIFNSCIFSLLGEQANLNIPVANGMLSVKPSSDGIIDAALVRQIDDRTLKELRALAENINTIIDAKATLTG